MTSPNSPEQKLIEALKYDIHVAKHSGNEYRVPRLEEELGFARSLLAELAELREKAKRYDELIFAVARKYENESRHETALRYIRRAEEPISVRAGVIEQKERTK